MSFSVVLLSLSTNGDGRRVKFVFCAAGHVPCEGHVIAVAGCHQCQQLMWLLAMHGFSSRH